MSNILIISPEPWSAHTVSKHHYAVELAKRGHSVVYLGPPNLVDRKNAPLSFNWQDSVAILCSGPVLRGIRFLPSVLRRLLEARWLSSVEKIVGFHIDVVWLFENSRFYDMSFAGERVKIYHQVDLNQNFNPYIASITADYVFCSSQVIYQKLTTFCSKVNIIHHGVDVSDYCLKKNDFTFSKDKINCIYIGNMSMKYLDRDLIVRCVRFYGNVNFHFFGGFVEGDPFEEELSSYRNVFLYGKVPSTSIPSILTNADILMVTYQKAHFRDQSNPHKIMEYMLSGKVTVATFTSEYESESDLLAMCSPEGDYVDLLGSVIDNIDVWNNKKNIAKRRAFAIENTYSCQLDRISDAMGNNGFLISNN